jgi:hypothetical protein
MTVSLKVWRNPESTPTIRTGMLWPLAWAIATKAGWAKVQVIDEFSIIILETKEQT